MIQLTDSFIRIDTPSTTLLLRRTPSTFACVHYGSRLGAIDKDYPFLGPDFDQRSMVSFYGCGDYREPLVSVRAADGVFSCGFAATDARMVNTPIDLEGLPSAHGEGTTLELEYTDVRNRLILVQRLTVFPDSDAICSSFVLENRGDAPISIRRIMSLCIDLPGTGYTVSTFDGQWARERQRHNHVLNAGVFVNDSKQGSSSNIHNPYILVSGGEATGFRAFNLIYSGNHKSIVETTTVDQTHILTGMSDFMFDWTLAAGARFCTPQAVAVYADTENEVIARMHAFVRDHIVPAKWSRVDRPVLINNWEATYFDFDESRLLKLAGLAADAGIELFVLDDGWFGDRKDDHRALGDWFDNMEKTGGGLGSLSTKIREKGLKFGIWVEPEMISEDSDLFRAHPEYAMRVPEKEPIRIRNQLMLDMANPQVQDYILDIMKGVFTRCQADYVKWDYNRLLCDVFTNAFPNMGEYFHRYILGVYRVIRELTTLFPNTLFESCAGGGSRYDLGMLCFMPQTWASDNTDAYERLFIQDGTLQAYPQNTMGAHVSICPNHQTNHTTPIESRFNVASAGMFGYEMDLGQCSSEELATIQRQVAFYKQHRSLLQRGRYIRLRSIFEGDFAAWMVVAEDQSEAMLTLVATHAKSGKPSFRVKLEGLDESATYALETRGQENVEVPMKATVCGDVLCHSLLSFGSLFNERNAEGNYNGIASRMVYLRRV